MTRVREPLPLNPLEFSILLVLADDEAAYGYGIVKGIAERTHGAVRLAPGNLYQVLERLLARRWIREVRGSHVPAGADERRRYYGLTAAGRAAMRAEAARLRALMPTLERLELVAPRGSA
jgi:DNA-binding PadR family transcriptional regulator